MEATRSRLGLLLADVVAVVAAFRIAFLLRYEANLFAREPNAPAFDTYYLAIVLAVGIWTILFFTMEVHDVPVLEDLSLNISQLITACAFLVILLLAGSYLAKTYYSRLLLVFLSILLVGFLGATRWAYHGLLVWLRKKGIGLRRVVVVGQSELARELAERIKQRWNLQYELAGFLSPASHRGQQVGNGAISGRSEEIARSLKAMRVDELIFTIPVRRESEILEFVAHCQKQGISVRLVPEYYELHTSQIQSVRIDGIPLLELKETLLDPPQRLLKRMTDCAIASGLMVLLGPAMLVIAAILRLGFKRPAIKREVRIGLGGQPFTMYRFDVSHAVEREGFGQQDWKSRFCRFLHRYSFSELPQLWNVLRGEMSIVGPRPETPERVRHYSAWHRRRLELKAGITGLAQVRGLRGEDSSDLKTKYDLEYAAKFSPFLDLTLILATFGTLYKRRKQPGPELLPTLSVPTAGSFGPRPSDRYH